MTQKTIRANVTLGVPCPDQGTAYLPPMTPVTLDATEADAILARHGGEEVPAEAAPEAPAEAAPRRRRAQN